LTVPFTVATVAGSMGVAAGAIAGCPDDMVLDMLLAGCSSFLLHATVSSKAHNASTLTDNILKLVFLFMMSFFL
jgi:hypothetical protein